MLLDKVVDNFMRVKSTIMSSTSISKMESPLWNYPTTRAVSLYRGNVLFWLTFLICSENPYGAAQRFLDRNELPSSYVDQVVQFIEKNTAGVTLGGGNDDYVDPFTGKVLPILEEKLFAETRSGASRYRSSASSVPTGPASSYVDPYTGASRYSGAPQPDPVVPKSSQPFQPVVNKSKPFLRLYIHHICSLNPSHSSKQIFPQCKQNCNNSMMPFVMRL